MSKQRPSRLRISLALVALLGVMLLAQGCMYPAASAQTPAQASPLPRTITVVGEGSVKIKPDLARTTIGVETVGATVKEATGEASRIMDAVIAAVMELGVEEKDIQTSGYSVWVDRSAGPELRTAEASPTYRVNNDVAVAIRDLDKVSSILDAAIEAGANTIYGISFSVAEPKALESQARAEAVQDALARAQELASLHNVQVGAVVSVSEIIGSGGGYYVSFRETAAMAYGLGGGGAGPVSPGELELTLRLQVVYEIR